MNFQNKKITGSELKCSIFTLAKLSFQTGKRRRNRLKGRVGSSLHERILLGPYL